jgi:hypothetical protein
VEKWFGMCGKARGFSTKVVPASQKYGFGCWVRGVAGFGVCYCHDAGLLGDMLDTNSGSDTGVWTVLRGVAGSEICYWYDAGTFTVIAGQWPRTTMWSDMEA